MTAGRRGGVRHGFTGAMYYSMGDGLVEVVAVDGRRGVFDREGRWRDGELWEADPELCVWMGAERIAASHRLSAPDGGRPPA